MKTMSNREKLEQAIKNNKVSSHHTALSRGYICKDCGYVEEYAGKYGKGFIEHRPNVWDKVSNSYHIIEYFIYK